MAGRKKFADEATLLKNWNPMRDVYNDMNFNKYDSGPGANLDPSLHACKLPNAIKQTTADAPIPFLLFKNVPMNLNKNGIGNLCRRFGRVSGIRYNEKFKTYFVDFETVNDMEAAFRALEQNEFGIQVMVGKSKTQNKHNKNHDLNISASTTSTKYDGNSSVCNNVQRGGLDLERREIALSEKQHPRPQFTSTPIVTSKDYDAPQSLLQKNDPKRQYLITEDAHALEHAGLENAPKQYALGKHSYRAGRAFLEMPQQLKEALESDLKTSLGNYNAENKIFKYPKGTVDNTKDVHKCIVCSSDCDMICARCKIYYCSKQCQKTHWPEHRLICGKPNELAAKVLSQQNNKTAHIDESNKPPYKGLPENGDDVCIVSISKANVVFVRAKSVEADERYFKLISKVHADGAKCSPLKVAPKPGEIVLTLFEKQYVRAMVLNTSDLSAIRIIHMDYGNLDVKAMSNLFEAPDNYIDLPRLVIPVMLKGVRDCFMTVSLRTFTYAHVESVVFKMVYDAVKDFDEAKGAYNVELIDTMSNQNLNHLISRLCHPEPSPSLEKRCFESGLKRMPLPTGKNVELIVMDNSLLVYGFINCSVKPYVADIQKFQQDLQEYGESTKDSEGYTPVFKELCVAKYSVDNKWYRGIGYESVGDGFPTIEFIDYGNVKAVPIKDIRRYPEQFSIPVYTAHCEIEGLPKKCNKWLVERLEHLIPNGSVLRCDNVERHEEENDDYYIITLVEIIAELQRDGLLINHESEID